MEIFELVVQISAREDLLPLTTLRALALCSTNIRDQVQWVIDKKRKLYYKYGPSFVRRGLKFLAGHPIYNDPIRTCMIRCEELIAANDSIVLINISDLPCELGRTPTLMHSSLFLIAPVEFTLSVLLQGKIITTRDVKEADYKDLGVKDPVGRFYLELTNKPIPLYKDAQVEFIVSSGYVLDIELFHEFFTHVRYAIMDTKLDDTQLTIAPTGSFVRSPAFMFNKIMSNMTNYVMDDTPRDQIISDLIDLTLEAFNETFLELCVEYLDGDEYKLLPVRPNTTDLGQCLMLDGRILILPLVSRIGNDISYHWPDLSLARLVKHLINRLDTTDLTLFRVHQQRYFEKYDIIHSHGIYKIHKYIY